jgi:HK97 family phage prohead protease
MKINFPMKVTAADSGKRTISGTIVTWGEEGNTSAGRTVFEKDSIAFGKNVKLLWEHRLEKPLGKLVDATVTPEGIEASFKIASTMAGEDALVEAAEGLRDGFSVGVAVNEWSNKEGVMSISSAELVEVSLVTEPAIRSARVEQVAASEEKNSEAEKVEEKPTTEGDQVSDTTAPAAPAAEVAVEAAAAPAPVQAAYYTTPRVNLNVTAGEYVRAQVNAMRGDTDARDLVAALDIATVSENAGVVPPTYLRDVIGVVDASRPFVDSIDRAALPATGMKIYTPRITAQATVAQTAEGVEFDSTDTAIDNLETTVVKFAGANVVNVELVDRSEPSYIDQLIRMLAASYAQKTDAYAAQIAADNAGVSSGTSIYKAIADGIADSFGVMRFTPNRLLVAPSGGYTNIDFANLVGAVDGSNRPLFAAAAPSNAGGLVTQGSTNGTVAGLDLIVDPNYTGNNVGDKAALVYPSAAMTFHESGTLQLRSTIVANGRVEIGIYGYVAVVNKYPTAFRSLFVS